jgi:hypothetical protein
MFFFISLKGSAVLLAQTISDDEKLVIGFYVVREENQIHV